MSEHGICPMSVQVKSSFDNKSIDRSELKRKGNMGKSGSLATSNVVQNVFKPVRLVFYTSLLRLFCTKFLTINFHFPLELRLA